MATCQVCKTENVSVEARPYDKDSPIPKLKSGGRFSKDNPILYMCGNCISDGGEGKCESCGKDAYLQYYSFTTQHGQGIATEFFKNKGLKAGYVCAPCAYESILGKR